MAEVSKIEDVGQTVDSLVRSSDLTGEALQAFRLKLQNAKSAIEALENDLAEMEARKVSTFESLEADRLVKPAYDGSAVEDGEIVPEEKS